MSQLFQLTPFEESFYRIASRLVRNFDVIILCEGESDVHIVKDIVKKVNMDCKLNIGISSGGGQPNVYELLEMVMAIIRLSRRLKHIGLIVDSEDRGIEDKFHDIINIVGKNFNIIEEKELGGQVFLIKVRYNVKNLPLYIAINGDVSLRFSRHMLEDHCVKLAELENKLNKSIDDARASKEVINMDECRKIIEEADINNIKNAFPHIVSLLKHIGCNVL